MLMFSQSLLSSLPHSPGVYTMRNRKKNILYVGKAKDLHKRLASYLRTWRSGQKQNKTVVMLGKVENVDILITQTEKEALLLEASLIKKHKPRYNIVLRDDKSYPYIRVTTEERWPRVHMTRRRIRDKSRYFGPYASAKDMWATLRLLSTLFPLRSCKGSQLKARSRPCLNSQIGKCPAPCTGQADRKAYLENVDKILMLLEGRSKELLSALEQQMADAAQRLDFERAAIVRDQISALGRTLEKQIIASNQAKNQDIFGFSRKEAAVSAALLFVRNGQIVGSRSFFLTDPYGEDPSILSQILVQYYTEEVHLPAQILLPFAPDNLDLHTDLLNEKSATRVQLKIPRRGENRQLVRMANTNAAQVFEEKEKKRKSWEQLQKTMQQVLRLERAPQRIECLDISNISGQYAIGSLVSFRRGEKDTANFRRYRIRSVDGPNDYAMMREVLERRFRRGREETNLPDMFLVDGGKGQLGIAIDVAKELGIQTEIDWIGIAKQREDDGEKLYKPGQKNPIILPSHNPVLLYLMRIRDESHRYGITSHRRLRNKETLASEIDAIPGIGRHKRRLLLEHIGSVKRIRKARPEELSEVPGIGPQLAGKIYRFFNGQPTKDQQEQ
ncbi:MAG: excinuclease ABC subunit C [Deltaproteobacteria bacterium]|nr:MAG: excinuclease ABC subunit C [Deltaproteobacteria bacterium]